MICLVIINKIDDLILYLGSKDEHALYFQNRDSNDNIFHDSNIDF